MAKNDIWKCKDGTKVKMCDMTKSHLKNAMNYFRHDKEEFPMQWKLLETENQRRIKAEIRKEEQGPIESRFDILDL